MSWIRIVGVVAALWGAGIVLSFFLRSEPMGGGAYGAGQLTGTFVGIILLCAGIYATVTGGRRKTK